MSQYDTSQIGTYQECEFKYYLQYVRGLKRIEKDDSDIRMDYGSHIHTFKDLLHKAVENKETIDVGAIWNDFQESESNLAYKKNLGIFACKSYFYLYKQLDSGMKSLASEIILDTEIAGHQFVAKLDAVIERDGCIYGQETKTTNSASYDYFNKFIYSSQITAQDYLIKKHYKECFGIEIDLIESKCLKSKPRTEFFDLEEIKIDGKIHYNIVRFQRDIFNRSPLQLKVWEQEMGAWMCAIEESKKTNVWKRKNAFWGGSLCARCPYNALCIVSEGNDLNPPTLETQYETTDPYAYLNSTSED